MTINSEFEPDTAAYLDTHGCKRRGNKLLIPSRCVHLQGDAAPYSCDLHGTIHQPVNCQVYPGDNNAKFLAFNGCGFRKDLPPLPPDEPVLRKTWKRR
ncbi:MAG: hypothetical protein LUO93_11550 [Methanomicrobiales archaeon]|nr:hypothetical protein [Methanomicrobiales archaeon]